MCALCSAHMTDELSHDVSGTQASD